MHMGFKSDYSWAVDVDGRYMRDGFFLGDYRSTVDVDGATHVQLFSILITHAQ